MKLINFTAPNGARVYVNPETVCVITDENGGTSGALAVIYHTGGQVHVRESKEQVKSILITEAK